jgi:hypothetical protein
MVGSPAFGAGQDLQAGTDIAWQRAGNFHHPNFAFPSDASLWRQCTTSLLLMMQLAEREHKLREEPEPLFPP